MKNWNYLFVECLVENTSEAQISLWGRFLSTDLSSLIVLGLLRFSIPSLVSFGKLKFFEGISPFPQSLHTT